MSAQGFKIGQITFADADATVTLIAKDIKGRPQYTVMARKSFSANNNGKAEIIPGQGNTPAAIVAGKAEPDWKIGFSTVTESVLLARAIGDGYMATRYDLVIVLTRPGIALATFKVKDGIVEKGFGISSDGNAPTDELSGKCRLVSIDNFDPYKLSA